MCSCLDGAEAARDAVRACVSRLAPAEDGAPRGIDLWLSPHFLVEQARFLTLDALWRGVDAGIAEARHRAWVNGEPDPYGLPPPEDLASARH